MPDLIPTPDRLGAAAANAYDMVLRGGVADLRRTPARIIDEAPQRTVFRYLRDDAVPARELPVLLVPPLAAPTICFDLRRGCSLAEHLLGLGHPTYLLEYGRIAFSDKQLGLEHWVEDVLPAAIERVSEDAGGSPVQLVGWCLGGIMSLLAVAGDGGLPVAGIALFASPFDFTRVRVMAPLRPLANITNGMLGTALYRALGGAPAPLVKRAFQLTAIDKHLTKPVALAANLHDRDFLAHVEAVDNFTNNMHAYPGRTMGQLYHRFFRVNELAGGRLELGDRVIDLADVRVPVLSIAGATDVLAPRPAVHHVARLLPNAPQVRLETAPGGHLGVLTGRAARRTSWRWLDEFLADTTPKPARRHLRVVA
jgi:polyhydroxyalkanoate synthase subunit PhaC